MNFSSNEIHSALKQHFGFDTFRSGQEEIILSILDGSDTLAVMPTGGGKSLCFQLPSILLKRTTLIISPLIALMKDQVDSLNRLNIPATFINSTLVQSEINEHLNKSVRGEYRLLYVAPERLESPRFVERLQSINLSFLAIDEAHCISEWGHDFRPSYLNIIKVIEQMQRLPIVALTATATPEVQEDIIKALKMKEPKRFIKGFDRPNLTYIVERSGNKIDRIKEILKKPSVVTTGGTKSNESFKAIYGTKLTDGTRDGSTIIYCGTRKRVESFGSDLNNQGIKAEIYHGGMKTGERKSIQERFMSGKSNIIIATNAFGMGVDKNDVRRIIHCDMTLSLEAYYQEAGRAGRDGKPSQCLMLYQPRDRGLMDYFLEVTYPELNEVECIYNSILDFCQVAIGSKSSVVAIDTMQMANHLSVPYMKVESVLSFLERNHIISDNYFTGNTSLYFTASKAQIENYHKNTTDERKNVLEALLRSVSADAFNKPVAVNVNNLLMKYGIRDETLKKSVDAFEFANLLKLNYSNNERSYKMLIERMPFSRLPIDRDNYRFRKELAYKKLDVVQNYIETSQCKRNFILEYFKETDVSGNCGKCSSCSGIKVKKEKQPVPEKYKYLNKQILKAVASLDGRYGKTLLAEILNGQNTFRIRAKDLDKLDIFGSCKEFSIEEIVTSFRIAITKGELSVTPGQYPTIYITPNGRKNLSKVAQTPSSVQIFHPKSQNMPELYNKLLTLRSTLSIKYTLHPERIISQIVLRNIAEMLPTNQSELALIPGIGSSFVNRYGNLFLHTINEYLKSKEPKTQNPIPEHIRRTAYIYNREKSITKVSAKLNVSDAQAAQYLQQAIESGIRLDVSSITNKKLFEQVRKCLEKKPKAPLSYIRMAVTSDVSYPELRVVAAFVRKAMEITI